MKILVTGHKGFIGSTAFWGLRAAGHEVDGIDRKENETIIDSSKKENKYNVIVHTAANLFDNFEENLESTKFIVNNYNFDKLIFFSSAAVYGNCCNAKEGDRLFPFGKYGETKLAEEEYIEMKLSDQQWCVFRLSNVYGIGSDHGFYSHCIQGVPTITYPDHIRDYVHVNDVVSTVKFATHQQQAYGLDNVWTGVFNLSSGEGIRNIELFEKMHPGKEAIISEMHKDEISVSVLNSEKAQQYGFHPRSLRLR